MYILNYGNNEANGCKANIHFHSGAPTALATAFTGAGDEGAMQIQALSDVEFRTDVAQIDATAKGNNLYMLSDAGNVVTQTFNYKGKYVGTTGLGLFTIWAEDREGMGGTVFSGCPNNWAVNRNSMRGNVYLNHDVKVEREGANGTETNVIAANNVRTTSYTFTSSNTANDTTNVISRKGDIWLGYSINAKVYNPAEASNSKVFNDNKFSYTVGSTTNAGVLNIKAG